MALGSPRRRRGTELRDSSSCITSGNAASSVSRMGEGDHPRRGWLHRRPIHQPRLGQQAICRFLTERFRTRAAREARRAEPGGRNSTRTCPPGHRRTRDPRRLRHRAGLARSIALGPCRLSRIGSYCRLSRALRSDLSNLTIIGAHVRSGRASGFSPRKMWQTDTAEEVADHTRGHPAPLAHGRTGRQGRRRYSGGSIARVAEPRSSRGSCSARR